MWGVGRRPCEIGCFCHFGVKVPCPAVYVGTMLANSIPSARHFSLSVITVSLENALNGDLVYFSSRVFPCPGGSYDNVAGLSFPFCSGEYSPGYFCPPLHMLNTELLWKRVSTAILPPLNHCWPAMGTTPSRKHKLISTHDCDAGNYCYDGVRNAYSAGTFDQIGHLSTPVQRSLPEGVLLFCG